MKEWKNREWKRVSHQAGLKIRLKQLIPLFNFQLSIFN